MSWLRKLGTGLKKTSQSLTSNLGGIFSNKKLDDATLDDLLDTLILADIGTHQARDLCDTLRKQRFGKETSVDDVKAILSTAIASTLAPVAQPLTWKKQPHLQIILVVGVNGSGKTTTIAKLASDVQSQGLKPAVAAGDTFRAGAVRQLQTWAERLRIPCYATTQGGDAAALAFDAIRQAQADKADILFIDTAGRLHNQANLMQELEKIVRVIQKHDATAPHHCLMVLDATTGQTMVRQVEQFRRHAPLSGLIITKLDGSAKAGAVLSLAGTSALPIHALGVGEQADDYQPFTAEQFAAALLQQKHSNPTN